MVGLSCRVMGTIVAFGGTLQIRKINVEKSLCWDMKILERFTSCFRNFLIRHFRDSSGLAIMDIKSVAKLCKSERQRRDGIFIL